MTTGRSDDGREDDVPDSAGSDGDLQTEPPGDPVLTGDVVIDEALVRLGSLDSRDVGEHPAEFEQIHRVLRDSLAGNRQQP